MIGNATWISSGRMTHTKHWIFQLLLHSLLVRLSHFPIPASRKNNLVSQLPHQVQLRPQANPVVQAFLWDCNTTAQSPLSYCEVGKYTSTRDTSEISLSGRSATWRPKAVLRMAQTLQLGWTPSWQDCRVPSAYGLNRTTDTFSQLRSVNCNPLDLVFWMDSLYS